MEYSPQYKLLVGDNSDGNSRKHTRQIVAAFEHMPSRDEVESFIEKNDITWTWWCVIKSGSILMEN